MIALNNAPVTELCARIAWSRPATGRPQRMPHRLAASTDAVALTFDDGPDPRYTDQLLDLLAQSEVKASFFLIASEARRHPGLVRRLQREGHSIGSHGYCHRHAWLQPGAAARRDVHTGARALADLLGVPVRWYRPPHGALRRGMIEAAEEEGQQLVLWSRSAVDWGPWGTPAGVARRLRAVGAGDVVLMHDGRNRHNRPDSTLAALPDLLTMLQRRRLTPVGLDQASLAVR